VTTGEACAVCMNKTGQSENDFVLYGSCFVPCTLASVVQNSEMLQVVIPLIPEVVYSPCWDEVVSVR
jgi:hypothetical protein